ncbi:MAG: oligosaccharide flippase family protein, partial [Bacteroidia bacterium]|nr:oligosaccharide flippase family protein [Bacteroidia bacterium]
MVSNATGLLTGLFTAPLYVQYLGEAAYGSLLLISVIILYAELVDLGISGGCLRHTSAALRCGEVHRIPGLLGTAWLIQVAMASVGTVVLIGFSSWLMRSLLQIPDFLLAEVIFAFRLNAVSFWLNFVSGIPATVATAWGRFDIYGKVSAISLILKAIGGVGAAGLGFGLVGVGFVSLFVDSFVLGYNLWMANRFFSLFPWRLTWDKKSLRDILLFGRAITLTAVFQRVMAHWEKILLGRYVSASIVPYYSIPHSIP